MEEVPDSQEELGHYCYQLYQHKVVSSNNCSTFVSLPRKITHRGCVLWKYYICTELDTHFPS